MNKKKKGPRPLPRRNQQIPNSMIHPFTDLSSNTYLDNARTYPIYGCWIMEGWQDSGITPVVVARLQGDGRVMFGVYMVDHYCLGIKDAFTRIDYSRQRFERDLPEFCINIPLACSVEFAHELIYGALEYAEKIGFKPHPDFYQMKADILLDPPDAHLRENKIVFGHDGKPFYISGPYDSEMRISSIINTLMNTCGPGQFDTLLMFGDMTEDPG